MNQIPKAFQLQQAFRKSIVGPENFLPTVFEKELKKVNLEVQEGKISPKLYEVSAIEKKEMENVYHEIYGEDEFLKDCQWDIVETEVIKKENLPRMTKSRIVGKVYFNYVVRYNIVQNQKLELIDSNIWQVNIDGGDGDSFRCMEIDGYYMLYPNDAQDHVFYEADDVFTKLSYYEYFDDATTDGAFFTGVKLENNLNINNLHDAVFYEDIERIKTLIEEGKDVNGKDKNGLTPLYYASINKKHIEITKLLLENGANPNIEIKDGKTVIDFIKKNIEEYGNNKSKKILALLEK